MGLFHWGLEPGDRVRSVRSIPTSGLTQVPRGTAGHVGRTGHDLLRGPTSDVTFDRGLIGRQTVKNVPQSRLRLAFDHGHGAGNWLVEGIGGLFMFAYLGGIVIGLPIDLAGYFLWRPMFVDWPTLSFGNMWHFYWCTAIGGMGILLGLLGAVIMLARGWLSIIGGCVLAGGLVLAFVVAPSMKAEAQAKAVADTAAWQAKESNLERRQDQYASSVSLGCLDTDLSRKVDCQRLTAEPGKPERHVRLWPVGTTKENHVDGVFLNCVADDQRSTSDGSGLEGATPLWAGISAQEGTAIQCALIGVQIPRPELVNAELQYRRTLRTFDPIIVGFRGKKPTGAQVMDFAGPWEGDIIAPGRGVTKVALNPTAAVIDFPQERCSGTVATVGRTAVQLDLQMTITRGQNNCRDNGYIRLTQINGVLNYEFRKSNVGDDTVWMYGRLHRP